MCSNILCSNNNNSILSGVLENFEDIKRTTNLTELNENYITKTQNIRYVPIIEQYNQHDIFETIGGLCDSSSYNLLINNLSNINRSFIFDSPVHGISHNEKVMTLSYIIGCEENLDKTDLQILFDASKYHDIGRTHDDEDEKHGLVSSQKVKSLINYDSIEDNETLGFIIESHSVNDIKNKEIFKKYKIANIIRAEKLSFILKDADALDRVRFSRDKRSIYSDLDPNFLRTETSKKLIKLSHQLDQLYMWYSEKI